jgi:hypothetical protein
MKPTKKIFFLLAASMVLFTACDKEVKVTGVTLNETSLLIGLEEAVTLTATIQPTGAEGAIEWASSNPAVATVVNGVVTGVSEGVANIVASVDTYTATCQVTVSQSVNFANTLNGSDYFLIVMDGVSASSIESKIVADFRPNEENKFLYIWDNTYSPVNTSGPNFYGEVEPWVSMTVGTSGWSGAGFFTNDGASLDKLVPVTANPGEYYLHIGIRSQDNATHVFGLDGQSNVRFAVGPTTFHDGPNAYEPIANFTRNGEWQQVEIPMTTLKNMGLLYSTGMNEKNVLYVLSGGTTGVSLNLDAVFIYKKAQ